MNWASAEKFDWTGPISNRPAKEEIGRQLAAKVKSGDVIGVGSGSTSYIALRAIGERVKEEKLSVSAICTSQEITMACAAAGVPVRSLLECAPDWCFDGADEVDPDQSLIKGRGGAMFLEKLVMRTAAKSYILADASKKVTKLGEKFAVPVEFLPDALHLVERELQQLGATDLALRMAVGKDGPIITQSGNFIFDVRFREIGKSMERDIKSITGVIESGLFIGHPVKVLMV